MITTHTSSRFERELATLKDEGSALLVVGTVPGEAYGDVTTQLLGNSIEGPRRRLLVTTDDRLADVVERLPDESMLPRRQNTRVISMSDRARSAAATSGRETGDIPMERVTTENLSTIGMEIQDGIAEFERVAGEFAPSELRVSVDSLTSLLDVHEDEDVFRFIHILNHLVRSKAGMIHYHLPIERDSVPVRTFTPLFDALVELRLRAGRLEQRWHLQDAAISSDWVEVGP